MGYLSYLQLFTQNLAQVHNRDTHTYKYTLAFETIHDIGLDLFRGKDVAMNVLSTYHKQNWT